MHRRPRQPRFGLRTYFLAIGLLAALPFAAITVYTTHELRHDARSDVANHVRNTLVFLPQMSADLLRSSENYVRAVAETLSSQPSPGNRRDLRRELGEALAQWHEYIGGGLLRPDGGVVTVGNVGKIVQERLLRDSPFLWKVSTERGPVVGLPILDSSFGGRVIPIGMALQDLHGKGNDIVFILVGLDEIQKDWDLLFGWFPTGTVYLGFEQTGQVSIEGPNTVLAEVSRADELFGKVPKAGDVFTSSQPDGTRRIWHFADVGRNDGLFGNDFLIGVGVPTAATDSNAYRVSIRNVLGLALGAIFFLFLGLRVLEVRGLRPLRSILQTVVDLGDGKFHSRTNLGPFGGQIGKLTESVDRTAELLERDEAERKRLFESLMESESRYRTLFDTSTDGILLIDARLEVIMANQAFAGMVGVPGPEALVGKPIEHIVDERYHSRLFAPDHSSKRGMATSTAIEVELITAGEERIPVEISVARVAKLHGRPERYVVIARDIRERRRFEEEKRHLNEELLHAQKMESVGLLAGGVAHDFNNLLTVIHGYLGFAKSHADSKEKVLEYLGEIEKAALRAGELTRQLLLFSRRQPMRKSMVDLNQVVAGLEKMLNRLIGENIELRTIKAAQSWLVPGNTGSIEQVIMNLVVNGRDAMPDGGVLTIEIENRTIDEQYSMSRPEARAGKFVVAAIRDTGVGMSRDVLAHIFEPLYTTKASGKGTGLGLSVVFGVVHQHGGWIEVESEPGRGTTFKLYFPAASEIRETVDLRSPVPSVSHRTGERILVVEDDDLIRKLVCQTLSGHGYLVCSARDKREAETVLTKEECEDLDLLLCDAILPDGFGLDVYKTTLAQYPDLKVVFCSGYTEEIIQVTALRDLGFSFLQKPFTVDRLLETVRETIESGPDL